MFFHEHMNQRNGNPLCERGPKPRAIPHQRFGEPFPELHLPWNNLPVFTKQRVNFRQRDVAAGPPFPLTAALGDADHRLLQAKSAIPISRAGTSGRVADEDDQTTGAIARRRYRGTRSRRPAHVRDLPACR